MAAVTSAATAAAARIGAALSDAQYFESSMVRPEDIRRQLDSRSTKDKLDAMKRVIALISLGKDASMFFPDVVKNVVATSLDVKKLVYLYLVHYAEHKQDLALLAINSFQKDLSDPNQHIRALSLRVLSSIRVKVILQVVILAINNAAKDSSAYVRKAAAHAISKVCALDIASKDLLLEPLQILISDRSTHVIGSAVAAFDDVCPYNWSIIHPHYRRICINLSAVEPWGQISITNMLLRYARTHFASPAAPSRNSDLTLLIESVTPLFVSLNHSVVVSAISVFFHLASPDEFCKSAVKPLMRLVAIPDDGGQAVALHIAAAVAGRYPQLLVPYVSEFYVSSAHSAPICNLRMKVLMTMCAAAGEDGGLGSKPHIRRALLAELKHYLFRPDKQLAASAARAIGCLATAHPASTPSIVKVLSSVVAAADNPVVVSESIAVLRRLLQRHPSAQAKALPQLIALLLAGESSEAGVIRDPGARSSIIWLIAEFYEKVQPIATEALRLLARGFAKEASQVKVQILNLAAKIVAWNEDSNGVADVPSNIELSPNCVRRVLLEYVISCARYDRDYDVRDKARMLHSLFIANAGSPVFKAAQVAFISRKPVPGSSDIASTNDFMDSSLDPDVVIGSMAHVLTGRRLFGFRPLEPWADIDSDAALRESSGNDIPLTTTEREYTGVGSSDFAGHVSSSNLTGMSWLTSQIMSAASKNTSADAASGPPGSSFGGGLAGSGVRYAPASPAAQPVPLSGGHVVDVDPENFYEDDDSADEDDDDGTDDDDDDAGIDGSDGSDGGDGDDAKNNRNVNENKTGPFEVTERNRSVAKRPAHLDGDSLIDVAEQRREGHIDKKEPVMPIPKKKPSSEYDLDALLGDIQVTETPAAESKATSMPFEFKVSDSKEDTQWYRVVEPWNCEGLEIDASFSRKYSSSGPDVTPVTLCVTNRGKIELTQLSFLSRCGDCFVCPQTLASLPPGGNGNVMVEARFRGKASGVRFAARAGDKVVGECEFRPSIGFVVRPRPGISPSDFLEAEKSLTGMFASEANISLSQPKQNDWMRLSTMIRDRMLETCFVSHVKTSVGSQGKDASERFSTVFAGFLPSVTISMQEQRPVLVRITAKAMDGDGGCTCTVWIGCEEVLFSANLMRLCRGMLTGIDREM